MSERSFTFSLENGGRISVISDTCLGAIRKLPKECQPKIIGLVSVPYVGKKPCEEDCNSDCGDCCHA